MLMKNRSALQTIELVDSREYSYMTKDNNNKPVTVLSSVNQSIISVAESLLSEAGIKYSVTGSGIKESFKSGKPVEVYSGITEIQVEGDDDIIAARKILMDLEELDFHEGVPGKA